MTTRSLPLQTRAARVETADIEARTIELVWSTGAAVRRYDWWNDSSYDEELVLTAEACDLTRLNAGAPLLNTHGRYDLADQIGVVERAWIVGPQEARAVVRFSRREDVQPYWQDVQDGVIRNVSVGYSVQQYEVTKRDGAVDIWRAVKWQPAELSLVPVPADSGAQVRGEQQQRMYPCIINRSAGADITQETRMDETTEQQTATETVAVPEAQLRAEREAGIRLERERQEGIRVAVRATGLGEDVARELIDAGTALDVARADILARAAARADAQLPSPTAHIETVRDETATRIRLATEAITHRMTPGAQISDGARQYRSFSLLRMAEECVRWRGGNPGGMSSMELVARAMTTSDFPAILADVANNRLRMAYEENVPSYTRWAARAPNAPDFKTIQVSQLSGAPDLQKVMEDGEITYGSMSDGKETYQVFTFAKIVPLSRQAIINDNLRAFDRLITAFSGAARRLENRTVYGILTANAAMADGVALFHSTHANLAGAGAAISATTLGAGRAAMRLQKGLQSEELNIAPAFIIVPATQEQLAYQFTSTQFVPAKTTDINEFRAGGRTALEPVVEAVLDASSTTAWYLAASPSQVDTIEYCYLDGSEGVFIESEMGFDVDGMKVKARLDFGAKAIDHRGLYKNPGA